MWAAGWLWCKARLRRIGSVIRVNAQQRSDEGEEELVVRVQAVAERGHLRLEQIAVARPVAVDNERRRCEVPAKLGRWIQNACQIRKVDGVAPRALTRVRSRCDLGYLTHLCA